MCGIVGYLGNRQATEVLVEGLSKLEYRGYDSAGVAINIGEELSVRKFKGRLQVLADDLNANPINGGLGIGHTRWATHGEPSDVNSHPHFNKEKTIAVVHNGIIENYLELREELQKEGYVFLSQTDTEVVAHLVDKFYEGNLLEAVYKATGKLRGAYALGVVCKDNNNELVAVRKDSPLIVGVGEDENFIASDIPAILKYTRDVIFLENDEYVHMQGPKVTILDENKNVVEKKINEINWDIEAASKGGYDCFMTKEMYEQPKGVEDTLMRRLDEKGRIKLDDIKITKEDLDKINKVYIVACGTAYHAGLCGASILERATRLPVLTQVASEFRYNDPIIDEKTLCIFVSQSGETADTLAALKLANEKGCTTIAVTNVLGSTISREAQHTLYTCAGPEIAVASTKAYTTQLVLLTLIALYIADKRGDTVDTDLMEQLNNLPEYVSKLIDDEAIFENYAKTLKDKHDCYFIGRSLDYASVLEGALKLKEVSYVHADAYIAGELKHGPIALIEPGTVVIAVATQPHVAAKTISNIQETIARGAEVILFTVEGQEVSGVENIYYLPDINPLLQSVLVAIPLQLIAYHTACIKGCDVDKPRNLAKSVTVE